MNEIECLKDRTCIYRCDYLETKNNRYRETLDLILYEATTGNKYDLIAKLAREILEEK
jgi:hypothetical protein